MMQTVIRDALAILVPGLALFLLMDTLASGHRTIPRPMRGLIAGGCLLAVGIPLIQGLSLARFISGITPGFSVPLCAWLVLETLGRLGGRPLFPARDLAWLRVFGVVSGLLLYPATLGGLNVDPYGAGWIGGPLFPVMGLLTAALIVLGFRFGWILLAAIVTWHLGGLESTNYWDYLIDPVFFGTALLATLASWTRPRRRSASE